MFDRVLNLPLQQVQLHQHGNVEALYDNPKVGVPFIRIPSNKSKRFSDLDCTTFCLS